MATKLRASYCRDLNPEAVPLDKREKGFCIACGSKAERDPTTSHWWHLEPRYCSSPNSTFVATADYDQWRSYEDSMQQLYEGLEGNRIVLDELQREVEERERRLAESSARHLRRMRVVLALMILAFLCSVIMTLAKYQ